MTEKTKNKPQNHSSQRPLVDEDTEPSTDSKGSPLSKEKVVAHSPTIDGSEFKEAMQKLMKRNTEEIKELKQLLKVRNDDAKDYSKTLDERNTEVKQAIIELREYWKDDIEPIYGQLTELLQKLGLGDK